MEKKPYELGIIVGRFQTFHSGHEDMIRKASGLCERLGVFIGSSQESGTFMNPFTYEFRKEMLEKVFGDRITIYPLPDIGCGNVSGWGDYVIDNVVEKFGRMPDIFISGKEEKRIDWFDGVEGLSVSELYVPKNIDISATQMREYFIEGDKETWKKFINEVLWDDFDKMREYVILSHNIKNTDSV